MAAEFTPISNIQTTRVRTDVQLPYGMDEQIGLNLGYVQAMIQIAGLHHIHITTDNEGRISQTRVQIVGINGDGSAIAGKTKVGTIPTYSHELDPNNSGGATSKHDLWPNLSINLNPNEMRERILNNTGNNYQELKKGRSWARQIDMAIKAAVRRAGVKNLLMTPPTLMDTLWIATFSLCLSNLILSHNIFDISFNETARLIAPITSGLENFKKGEGYRLSIIPVFEIDRYSALQAYSCLKPAVAPLDNLK